MFVLCALSQILMYGFVMDFAMNIDKLNLANLVGQVMDKMIECHSFQFYPKNIVQPWCKTHSKTIPNIIFVLLITDAQGFETVKNMGVKDTKQRPNEQEGKERF